MGESEMDGVDERIIKRLVGEYGYDQPTQDFQWAWSELRQRCPGITCRAQKKYIGFYRSQGRRTLFARLWLKRRGIKIGVSQRVWERAKPEFIRKMDFPAWDWGEGELVGFYLSREPEVVDLLDQCFIALSEGLYAVEPINTALRRQQAQLHETVRKDLAALKAEETLPEGGKRARYTTYAERNLRLRNEAIRIHKTRCVACGFDFRECYGDIGKDFIEVHHLHPMRDAREVRMVSAEKDLVVVCANCHRMIHRKKNKTLSIEELKEHVEESRRDAGTLPMPPDEASP